jgi:hypothetical protein
MRNREHKLLCPEITKYNAKRKEIMAQIKKEEKEAKQAQNGGST